MLPFLHLVIETASYKVGAAKPEFPNRHTKSEL